MLDAEASTLRYALRFAERADVGYGYPRTLRERVVVYARRAHAAGRVLTSPTRLTCRSPRSPAERGRCPPWRSLSAPSSSRLSQGASRWSASSSSCCRAVCASSRPPSYAGGFVDPTGRRVEVLVHRSPPPI